MNRKSSGTYCPLSTSIAGKAPCCLLGAALAFEGLLGLFTAPSVGSEPKSANGCQGKGICFSGGGTPRVWGGGNAGHRRLEGTPRKIILADSAPATIAARRKRAGAWAGARRFFPLEDDCASGLFL